jgi:hypothetical protein
MSSRSSYSSSSYSGFDGCSAGGRCSGSTRSGVTATGPEYMWGAHEPVELQLLRRQRDFNPTTRLL